PAWEAWQAAVAPQAFQSALALPPGVPADRVQTLSKAFNALSSDGAYKKDYQKVIGQPSDALVGDEAVKTVKAGLKQLFEDYRKGLEYLKKLPREGS
ncbi:MAG: hypothetical protein GTO40_10620, partial [Deltaproteobacteria bacterium]|nr:hypothetical protein [Deltaproteobacteria bacterium]